MPKNPSTELRKLASDPAMVRQFNALTAEDARALLRDRRIAQKTRAGRKGGKRARELGFPTPGKAPDFGSKKGSK